MQKLARNALFPKLLKVISSNSQKTPPRALSMLSKVGVKDLLRNCPQTALSCTNVYRYKSKRDKKAKASADSDVSDEEDEFGTEEIDAFDKGTKLLTVKVKSVRLDGVLKSALAIARAKVEEAFYEGRLRINGKMPAKKSDTIQSGDELDFIKGADVLNKDFLSVSRIEVLDITPTSTGTAVKCRRTRTLTIDNYKEYPFNSNE